MAIGSGVLLPAVAENPTFPILSALAYTTGLGYRPTCDNGFTCTYKIFFAFCHNSGWSLLPFDAILLQNGYFLKLYYLSK